MSKLCDVKNMYGQDFGITVTNATVSKLKDQEKLPKNMLIISSPNDEEGNDIGMPSLFATDYNGNQLQLSYATYTTNGLYPNKDGYLQMHIDGKTIIEKDKALAVDTNNLQKCSFNNVGVAKVSPSVSSRTNSTYPIDTFINVDKNGVLFLSDSFLEYMYKYIGNKIYENLYPLIITNIKGWLIDKLNVKYYPVDNISILGIDEANGVLITQQYTLQYDSLNGIGEEVNIDINNNDYPIKEIIFNNNTTTVSENAHSTKEIKMYRHSITFNIVFYPNYNLENSVFLDNLYTIKFRPQSFEGSQSLMFYFNQNNAFDKYSNEIFEPFKIASTTINLNQLRNDKPFDFMFNNQYRYFDGVEYNLQLLYITSNQKDNSEEAIQLINENINTLIDENYNNIQIRLSNDNATYNDWKGKLIKVNNSTNVITKLSDISSLYKYILTYTIDGKRSYKYENLFNVNYLLTNIYIDDNYLKLTNDQSITIYSINTNSNGNSDDMNTISGGSLNSLEDTSNVTITKENNKDGVLIVEPDKNNEIYDDHGKAFIYKIFQNLFDKKTLHEKEKNAEEYNAEEYNTSGILGDSRDEDGNYNNEVGFLLVFKGTFDNPIYITNGGEENNQKEYTIFNAITNIEDDINFNEKPIITHTDESISLPTHAQYHSLVYPNPNNVASNNSVLQILSFIKLDSFMFQNSSNRIHSLKTNKLWHNFSVYNAQGPTTTVKFGLDYGKFFNQHIKIFGVNYGHWKNQFRPSSGEFIFNNVGSLNPIEPYKNFEYSNSRFYVGIQEELIDNVIDVDTISIEWTLYARKNDSNINEITPITIVASPQSVFAPKNKNSNEYNEHNNFNGIYYYIYEINYINEYYTIDSNNKIIYKQQIVGWDNNIKIKYKWQTQQTEDFNEFDYELGFEFNNKLIDPNLVHIDNL